MENNLFGAAVAVSNESQNVEAVATANIDADALLDGMGAVGQVEQVSNEAGDLNMKIDMMVGAAHVIGASISNEQAIVDANRADAADLNDAAKGLVGTANSALVAISNENFNVMASLVGIPADAAVSVEAAAANPLEAIEVSVESKAAYLKKLWAKIKEFVKKLILLAKKAGVKALAWFANLEKAATAMEKEIGNLDPKAEKSTLDEKDFTAIRNKFAFVGIEAKKIGATEIVKAIDAGSESKEAKELMKQNETIFKSGSALVKAWEKDSDGKVTADDKKNVKDLIPTIPANASKVLADYGIKDSVVYVYRNDGVTAKALVVESDVNDVDPEKATTKADLIKLVAKAIRIKNVTASANKEALKSVKVDLMDTKDMITVCKAVGKAGKGFSKFVKDLEKQMDTSAKYLDQFEKAKLPDAYASVVEPFARRIQTDTMSQGIDAMMGNLNNSKNGLAVVKIMKGYYKKA